MFTVIEHLKLITSITKINFKDLNPNEQGALHFCCSLCRIQVCTSLENAANLVSCSHLQSIYNSGIWSLPFAK